MADGHAKGVTSEKGVTSASTYATASTSASQPAVSQPAFVEERQK